MFGYVLSDYLFVLSDIQDNIGDQTFLDRRDKLTYAFAFLCVGIGLSSYIQKLCFSLGGENLTYRLRVKLFEAYLMKDVGWFDTKDRAPGVLTNILLEDITQVNGLTTEASGILVEAALGMTISAAICIFFCWQLALVVIAVSPFMVLGGLGMSKL